MSADLQRLLPGALVVLGAIALGSAIGAVSPLLWIALVVMTIGIAILLAIRDATRPRAPIATSVVVVEGRAFRAARALYYAGSTTIGLLIVRPALGFTLSDWLFLASMGLAAAVVLLAGGRLPFLVPRAIVVGVGIFALGGLISSFGAVSPNASVAIVARMIYLTIVWFWLGTVVLLTREHVQIALAGWVGSAAISSGGAVYQYFQGDVIPGAVVHYGRMSGLTSNLNVLGGLAATAIVPAVMLALDGHRRSVRLVGLVSTGFILAGLFLSGSVGGMMAAATGIAVWLAIRGLSLRVIVTAVVLGVLGSVLLMSAASGSDVASPAQRILKVTDASQADKGTGGTLYTRLSGWEDAWGRISEQPFVGVGLDDGSQLAITEKDIHSMLVGPWFTAGILGLIGVLVLVIASLSIGVRAVRDSVPAYRSSTAAIFAALCGFLQFSIGEPILYVRYGWFPTALLVVIRVQQLRAERAREPDAVAVGRRLIVASSMR